MKRIIFVCLFCSVFVNIAIDFLARRSTGAWPVMRVKVFLTAASMRLSSLLRGRPQDMLVVGMGKLGGFSPQKSLF